VSVPVSPTLPTLSLTDDQHDLVTQLELRLTTWQTSMDLRDAYYNGNQLIRDLGISVPPQLRGLHTVVGWPATVVDTLDERLDVEGFRYASSSDGDDELWNIWQANNLDEESQLGHLDSLIYGCAYGAVGANDDGSALITVESPRHVAVIWDPRWRQITAALRIYGGDQYGRQRQATLYLPNETIMLRSEPSLGWEVDERDVHNLGVVPVARLANRQRTSERDGSSEITSQVMSLTDAACRTLLGMEVAREFHAAPQRYILGVSASAFEDASGNAVSAWASYTGVMNAIDRDDMGNVPTIWQSPSADLTAYGKVMGELRQELASCTRLPAYMLGETTQNPASADAIRSAENGLIRKAERRQRAFAGGWEEVMRLALRIQNNGALPDDAKTIETLWASAATPTPAATSAAITAQIAAGAVPSTSDVTRERLGYSVIERQRLKIDDKASGANEFLATLAKSTILKDSRAGSTAAREITSGDPNSAPPPAK
jgi:hypothetical protein